MPPSWSTRLLSSSNANTRSNSQYPSDREQATRPPPPRPSTSEPGRHAHNRSVSHPLPRLFSRKKSASGLNGIGSGTGFDLPLDESLVPVLAEGDSVVPGHKGSGIVKRSGLGGGSGSGRVVNGGGDDGGDDGKVVRRCVCCDSRVRVPREVERFRCMGCLTVCDVGGSRGRDEEGGLRREVLSLERTRGIVERCLIGYLEGRCRRIQREGNGRLDGSGKQAQNRSLAQPMPGDSSANGGQRISQQLSDAPVPSSPPDTPNASEFPSLAHSATIKDFDDFDLFASTRTDTPPPAAKPVPTCAGPPRQPSISRKPVPTPPGRKPPPPPPVNVAQRATSQASRPGVAHPPAVRDDRAPRVQQNPYPASSEAEVRKRYDRVKTIFRPLEDYMLATFGDYNCLNSSFSTVRPHISGRTKSESNIATPPPEPADRFSPSPTHMFNELDAKTLLLGDIGENGSWWAGKLDRNRSDKAFQRKKVGAGSSKPVSSKSPNIDWGALRQWYEVVHTAGEDWHQRAASLYLDSENFDGSKLEGLFNIEEIDEELEEAREHVVRALLKITENVLKRPTRPLKDPEDLRFLLVVLENPSLYPSKMRATPRRALSSTARNVDRAGSGRLGALQAGGSPKNASPRSPRQDVTSHTGIIKRALGLMANSSESCHRYLITWFSRFEEAHFTALVDLVGSFVTHRIARRSSKPRRKSHATDGGLIPDLSGGAMNTSAQLHAAMGLSGGGSVKKRADEPGHETEWAEDWQAKVAAKVMSLLFAANNVWQGTRTRDQQGPYPAGAGITELMRRSSAVRPQDKARRTGQLLHTSSFYNTLLDYHDLIADFKVWESRRENKFSFCQYPLFLSMGAKIKILEYDARRQMEIKAREAYFDQVIRQRAIDGYFHLRVRRDCMVDDSLRQISEAVGAGQEELKKGLRVHFAGEEGVDAGGPRKEWFLMLVRDVFDAEHGLFVYDDDSRTCYFNPSTFETSDQYYLVGALLGLAIYNSTILDIALPPFAFRKLLAAAPSAASSTARDNISSLTGTKGQMTYTLADLAEFRPALATGLQQLLDFDGDVETTYCWTFVAPMERYGAVTEHPLLPNGAEMPVTNANRAQFVDLYVRYLLDGAVARQFEPFKRGFFTVCAGNALSLFRAEEIELLVRGSDELLSVDSLRAVAVYENWKSAQSPHLLIPNPAEHVPQIRWFWEIFAAADIQAQRKLLSFLTGSDRIPAVGSTSLVLRIVRGGEGWGEEGRERYPVARTCFNMCVLWGYETKEVLEERLWRAVGDSEGFGLK